MSRIKNFSLFESQEKVKKLYINGHWVNSHTKKTFEVHNPTTGELIAKVADGGTVETKQAIDAAHLAFKKWVVTSAKQRSKILRKTQQILHKRADDIAKLIVLENGKPFREARSEVSFALGYFDWFVEEARSAYGSLIPSSFSNKRLWADSQSLGVVAAISSGNFPVATTVRKLAPALASGCTVVLKPTEQNPLTALAIAQICHDAGIPSGVVNVVIGSNPFPISGEMLNNPKVKKIGFTTSTEIGKMLMEKAAKSLKRISSELGYMLAIWDK